MSKKQQVLSRVFGDPQKKILKRLNKKVVEINALAPKYEKMSKKELAEQTDILRKKFEKLAKENAADKPLKNGKKAKKVKTPSQDKAQKALDAILPDAFAIIREMASRVLGQRHYDVQLIGGIALHEGNVAEMKTGEGKTLVATAPLYLNALTGKGSHLVTVNDYLAQLHGGWMGSLYHALGLSTGVIINEASFVYDPNYKNENHYDERMQQLRPATRKEAYAADVTYGTNNEFGFDYLRDNMVSRPELLRQRELYFAIVDEVDSILIDEARTPLIISAPAAENPQMYIQFAKIAKALKQEHYTHDEKRRSVTLTDAGVEQIEKMLGIKNLYSPEHVRAVYHMDQALKAQIVFRRDKDYVVTNNGEVVIVDEFTGRLMQGRRYNEGLHQAIEAKENVNVLQESQTLATISFQNYFRLYSKLSGMTGTAFTEAEEFQQIYGLDVIIIPTNMPMIRKDHNDKIFKTEKGKVAAIVDDVKKYNGEGRPVLIGSASIAKNELIGKALDAAGIKHEILNAKNNEREAQIVAQAGQTGAVTLATNIAGRGTDIMLGKGIAGKGGLVVIGSERHEARRIDNQLRGRGGRQGDPGDTIFYVSTEDDLMRIFQGDRISTLMNRLGVPEDQPIENKAVSKTLEAAQKRVEGYNFDMRKNVVQYDNVINRHRKVVYSVRRKILLGQDIKPEVERLISELVKKLVEVPARANPEFADTFVEVFPLLKSKIDEVGAIKNDAKREKRAIELVEKLYADQEKALTHDLMRGAEREIYMQVLDVLWMQHIENMQHLREGIHWRGVGQRDPLVEYRRESQKLFDSLQNTLQTEVLKVVFHLRRQDVAPQDVLDDEYDSELTRAAAGAVERGVNEMGLPEKHASDDDFKAKKSAQKKSSKKSVSKKKKQQRQNRKKGRR
ncbi:MAG: preprotein translocase subunit SecA [Candidatus Nomurabacteria bacterium]|jgi:preprotein translocase subunit SecA|nr:preprotein translocase subunit SecA [Candidatus Nomurabacteria bacterium]